jgi:uncharacterized membrane protein YadS
MPTLHATVIDRKQAASRGTILALTIAAAASFLSGHYGAPAMLFALLLGIAFNLLATESSFKPGIEFSSKTLLRFGVALLGVRLRFFSATGRCRVNRIARLNHPV